MDCLTKDCDSEAEEHSNYCKPCFDKVMQDEAEADVTGGGAAKSQIITVTIYALILLLIGCIFAYGTMPSSEPSLQQNTTFTKYDGDGEELYRVATVVKGTKEGKSFIQWVGINHTVKKKDIEKVKASQLKEAEVELAKLRQYKVREE